MNWKEFIEALIIDFRLTANQIANKCDINQPTITRLKSGGTRKPYPETISKLEKGLNIKIDDSDPENITYKKLGETESNILLKEEEVQYLSEEQVMEYTAQVDEMLAKIGEQISNIKNVLRELKRKKPD